MTVLFMGTPAFAAASLGALLDAGHDVKAVVTRPDAPAGRGRVRQSPAVKDLALARGVPVLQPSQVNDPAFLDGVADLGPDLIVVVAYGRILPRNLLDLPPGGAVNVHASLLPRLRGASPIVWAIARGERQTGVTTMRMVQRLDAGDILLQRATPIEPGETAGQLESRLAPLGAALLVETLAGLAAGAIVPRPQDESAATWAPLLRKDDGLIDWSRPAEEIERLVRAFDPWPAAHARRPGRQGGIMRIWKAAAASLPAGGSDAPPGTIVQTVRSARRGEDGLLVACGGVTALLVTEVQPEGRRRMPAIEAVSGRYLKTGDRLAGR